MRGRPVDWTDHRNFDLAVFSETNTATKPGNRDKNEPCLFHEENVLSKREFLLIVAERAAVGKPDPAAERSATYISGF